MNTAQITSEQLEALAAALPAIKSIVTDGPDLTDELWSVEHISRYTHMAKRQIAERIVKAEGFPRAIRVAMQDGSTSSRRWKRAEVTAWFDRQREC